MAFLTASASFTRYRLTDDVPQATWGEINDRLQRFAFQDIDNTADERSFGWVCFDNMLDNLWQTAPPHKGDYLAFKLRLDTRRIPAAVLKKHYTLELEQLTARAREQGQKYVTRDQKTELKEQVRLKLLARTLPIPATFDVVWNTGTNRIYLGSTQSKIQDMFEDLFTQTFELHLEPQSPYFLARNILGAEERAQLDDYEPGALI